MSIRRTISLMIGGSWVGLLLLTSAMFVLPATPALAQQSNCSDFPGATIDGDTGIIPPTNVRIDTNCTVRNFPDGLNTNFSFDTNGIGTNQWLVVFDNVNHTGEMSCNAVAGHKIWFTNGSSTGIKPNCQNLLIPVEKIDKQNPPGPGTVAIGTPFTYTLTMPVLFDPATGNVINTAGSVNELHSVTLRDDLNETGVDLTYVSHVAYWEATGTPVPHTFSNVGGLLTFDDFPIIPAGEQIIIELTVVLDDTPTNAPGTQFVNTAKWDFGRLIDDVFFEPLPGEWGISPPLTIAAPDLVVTKTGPAMMNLGQLGAFTIDVQNTGNIDAWDVTIADEFPGGPGPGGGMCAATPTVLSARVFASDGVTPVPGKSALVAGTDYLFGYNGSPSCEMTLTMLTPAAAIGPGERLIIDYQTQLDANTPEGDVLTNVAGAIEWFDAAASTPGGRNTFTRSLTDGTPGVADHEDDHTVTVALSGFFFEKTVQNLTSGANPAAIAGPGDTLRYSLRLLATDGPLTDFAFFDDLGALNPVPAFESGTLTLVPGTIPPGADTSNTDPNGGTNGSGILDIRGMDVGVGEEVLIQFDITLNASLIDGTVVTNQADLVSGGAVIAVSDDPNVNGQADPDVAGDEDPTRVLIQVAPPSALQKANTQPTAAVGEEFSYLITVPSVPHIAPIYDVRISDELDLSAADLRFVSVTKVSGSGAWTPVNTGTPTNIVIEDPVNGIDIPAGEQIVVEVTVVLEDSPTNVAGLDFTNTADYIYNLLKNDPLTERPGDPGTSPPMTIVAPDLVLTKTGPATMNLGETGDFVLDVQNTGGARAFDLTLTDVLPETVAGGMCDAAPAQFTARVFESDGVTPVSPVLVEGTDFVVNYISVPACSFVVTIETPMGSVGPNEHLIVSYQVELDADTQQGITLTNVAGATRWFSADSSVPNNEAREFTTTLTDGTVGVFDHEDAHTVAVALSGIFFEKTVENLTSGVSPTVTAAAGDTLRYTLRLQTTDDPLNDFTFFDDLGELNPAPVFVPGTLALVPATIPPGADTTNTDPNGGSNGTGVLDIRNLDLAPNSEMSIQFDITLDGTLTDGTFVTNQSDLTIAGSLIAVSDDPNVNGQASPSIDGDEDPTRVLIEAAPPAGLQKATTQATAAIGEEFSYLITVPAVPHTAPIYDVRVLDNLSVLAADLEFVSVAKVSGSGSWTPLNTGTATDLVIEDAVDGIDIPAGEQVVVEVTVLLTDTATNVDGLTFSNVAAYTYNLLDNDTATGRPGVSGTSGSMTVVEPELTLEKTGPAQMRLGLAGSFTLNVHNPSQTTAWGLTITDLLANTASGGTCDAPPSQFTAQVFESDGLTPVSPVLIEGTDYSVVFNGDPTCSFTLTVLTAAGALAPGQRFIVAYETSLDLDSQEMSSLTNIAGATEWFSSDVEDPLLAARARTYMRTLADGTVGVLDHEDAHTLIVFLPELLFEKTVANVTTGQNPGLLATPGDTLRYSIRVENLTDTDVTNLSIVDEIDRLNAAPAFAGGTLNLITVPAGADAANTSGTGGSSGTGLLDVRNLSLSGLGDSFLIEFEVALAPIIANASYVVNQSQLLTFGVAIADSDDPNVNGPADPNVPDDEDPTQILIESAPDFQVQKVSAYVTGDPNVLLAGETLRYTITVKNVGTDNATDAVLSDQVPANTVYVAGSTTLNGTAVADGPQGTSPLSDGLSLYAPEDPTPGAMRADSSATETNVATIVFDVVVDPNAIDGTVISNQGFVSALDGGVADQPSDDPRTPVVDDPTRDIVGNLPLIYAEKSAALLVDNGSPGIVDPADVLRYTITVYNNSNVTATNVVLSDELPANTTYVADTLTLNGIPVGQPDQGVWPLSGGIPISSDSQTPPVPAPGDGTLIGNEAAVIEFDLRVDDGVASGTLIINQAAVASEEAPNVLTDGDGNPATGPEPTVVVVGDAQQLTITKLVSVVGGGAAVGGATLEYVVEVVNIAAVPALYVEITDDLDMPVSGQLSYVDQSATMNGLAAGVSVAGSVLTADYGTLNGPLPPGESVTLRFRAVLDSALPAGTSVTNTGVVTWNDPVQTASASVTIDVGGMPGVGILNGTTWHDADFDNVPDPAERLLEGWTVELYRDDQIIHTTTTDVDGVYQISGLAPNYLTMNRYELRFVAPGAGPNTAMLGTAYSADFTNSLQRISDIVVSPGSNLQNLDLPIEPNGVVYDAILRTPVPGAILTLQSSSGSPLPSTCFDDPVQQNQVTLGDGYYKFDLNFSDPSCQTGDGYLIGVTVPPSGYIAGYSQMIPPASSDTTLPFDVPSCPATSNDAVVATAEHCEAQPSEFAPPTSVSAQTSGTVYYAHLMFDDSLTPGSSQVFNNHIPLDPDLDGAVSITKTTPLINVTRGQLVPYTITVNNVFGFDLPNVTVVDRFPAGFRYVEGSARFDGVASEPTINGRELAWNDLVITASGRHTIQLLLAIGSGVSEGEFINRAQVMSSLSSNALSGEATATVRLVPDPTFDCTDVIGKVFDDRNRNGMQDLDEAGIPGVRIVTARGLSANTDEYGRFHITCATVPREGRGSNFILKLDDRTLPAGFRASTQQVQVQRATRGKTLRFNFGASIHRVVGLDIADPVFEPDSVEIRPQWRPRLLMLLEELERGPAVLRISYLADIEDPQLVNNRLGAVRDEIMESWEALDCCYKLEIEPEVFWRLGGPPEQAVGRRRGQR